MAEKTTTPPETTVPLCVDLDGTLIKTDLLWESAVRLLAQNPLWAFALLVWWSRGRANLKRQIAARVQLDPGKLPYNEPFLEFLRVQRRQNRMLILASASDAGLVRVVSDYLGIFDEALGSDGKSNLRGVAKADALVHRFGLHGFDYAGNSRTDMPVWRQARQAIVVNATPAFAVKVAQQSNLAHTFLLPHSRLLALAHALRLHQWVKNAVVFVPLLAAHKIFQWPLFASCLGAFLAFCLCATSNYLVNDLLDLDFDRQHPTKRNRPFAAGDLPLQLGLALVPLTAIAGLGVGALLSTGLAFALVLYLALSFAYSGGLKQIALLDAFVLAGLYTLRLIGGHEATGVAYSTWLLMFCMFIFLSLALVKRFQELRNIRHTNQRVVKGRGYVAEDIDLVAVLGLGSGVLAVLVLALYVNSDQVLVLYRHPTLLLLGCPLLLYWISRVWLIAHRGQMHDDPVVFALKDKTSYVVGVLMLVVMWLAT